MRVWNLNKPKYQTKPNTKEPRSLLPKGQKGSHTLAMGKAHGQVRLRLARAGQTHRPFYRIVALPLRKPRDAHVPQDGNVSACTVRGVALLSVATSRRRDTAEIQPRCSRDIAEI